MAGKIRHSFTTRMLVLVLGTAWSFLLAFVIWGYHREKEYKVELLDTQLQSYNNHILSEMMQGSDISSVVKQLKAPMPNMRVTLIDSLGRVTFDSAPNIAFGNQGDRPEVEMARKEGHGYVTMRTSNMDGRDYFVSATHGPYGIVLRSAVPYNTDLISTLSPDWTFFWILAVLAVIVSLIGWIVTRNVSRSIEQLNSFAAKAERGDRIIVDKVFPHDELGNISSHIVHLYSRLQQVMAERDIQQAELRKAEQEKELFKKQLTIDINHELKTPVFSILVGLETLRDFPDLPQEQHDEIMQRLLANTGRLQGMLKDISIITRLDEGHSMISMEPFDIHEAITETVSELRPSALKKNMQIVMQIPEGKEIIQGNRNLIEGIFRNLIVNSTLYSGGSTITVSTDGKGSWSVGDDGCGIPEKHHAKIFSRFYRLEAGRTRKTGGTGLGLAIVKLSVELHGGTIKLANTHPGVCFTFTLPGVTP